MNILIKYWIQIAATGALIFSGVNFLISSSEKRKYKRFELFQEKKIEAVLNFFSSNHSLLATYAEAVGASDPKGFSTKIQQVDNLHAQCYHSLNNLSTFYNRLDFTEFDEYFTNITQIKYKIYAPFHDALANEPLELYFSDLDRKKRMYNIIIESQTVLSKLKEKNLRYYSS